MAASSCDMGEAAKRESRPMSRQGSSASQAGQGSLSEAAGPSVARRMSGSHVSCRPRVSSEDCKSLTEGDHTKHHTPGTQAKLYTGRERCYDQPKRHVRGACRDDYVWNNGKYCKDDCGSGIVPKRFDFIGSRRIWCRTPLSMYQGSIGELGRQILCREKVIPRDVKPEPPCNVCEYILPPCRGYYRRYDCIRPCEEEYTTYKQGRKTYRDRVARYWEPCLTKDQKNPLDVNSYAGHNVYLGLRIGRKNQDIPCW